MKLISSSFNDGDQIPAEFAFGRAAEQGHVALSANRNPHLAWSDVPPGTRAFVLICHDPDVPSRADDVNQEGREVPAALPRIDFFHWVLINLPAQQREIVAGSHSDGITTRGKPGPRPALTVDEAVRHGRNDYSVWFEGDPDMRGQYYGYDGPCPPWNDSIVHRYVFTLYALDVPELQLPQQTFNGTQVRVALAGHVLAEAVISSQYTLNRRLL